MKPLGLILFETVQEAQGYAFISDGLKERPDEEVLGVARIALEQTNRSARQLRAFIRKYGSGR